MLKTDWSGIYKGDGTTVGSKLKRVSNLSDKRVKAYSLSAPCWRVCHTYLVSESKLTRKLHGCQDGI